MPKIPRKIPENPEISNDLSEHRFRLYKGRKGIFELANVYTVNRKIDV